VNATLDAINRTFPARRKSGCHDGCRRKIAPSAAGARGPATAEVINANGESPAAATPGERRHVAGLPNQMIDAFRGPLTSPPTQKESNDAPHG